MTQVIKRIIKLQRRIHKSIRSDVRRVLGPQPRELKRYYEAYKREFRGPSPASSKEELLKHCARSQLILMGDYHTFAQSQKAALRLLRELVDLETPIALGLEMIKSSDQQVLNAYMSGSIDDKEFLAKVDYAASWGFPWENFKPLLEFAREHNIPVLGLNHDDRRLVARDEHAAGVISDFLQTHPKMKLFTLYGDLHLSRGHIPKHLRRALKERGLKARTTVIFQNAEAIYWRLAEQGLAHTVDVVALGRGRFCIVNAAPWVKLQSYLEWAERGHTFDTDEDGPNIHEIAHERLKGLAEALGLKLPENVDFTVQTVNDLRFLANLAANHGLRRDELKAVKYHVLGNRNAFVPSANIIYLASPTTNAVNEGVSVLAHATLSRTREIFHDPRAHFFGLVLGSTLAYFGSKVLNHKRKCDLEDDFRLLLARKLERGALRQEKMQRKVAKFILRHCQAQREYLRDKRYRAPLAVKGPQRVPIFLESSRKLGAMLGEKLYASFVEGRYPSLKVERLFMSKLDDARASRDLYLKLVEDLERAPLQHSSKLDLF